MGKKKTINNSCLEFGVKRKKGKYHVNLVLFLFEQKRSFHV